MHCQVGTLTIQTSLLCRTLKPLILTVHSRSANVKFYFGDDVIEREREVKQVQISWRLCVIRCHIFGLLVMVTAIFSSEKVNNNSYENKIFNR